MTQKLIALDMDGTLLTSDKTLTPTNKQAIRDAQTAGHVVMICSGRPHEPLIEYLASEGLADLPLSASNGTITLVDGNIIDTVGMDRAIANQVITWLIDNNYPVNLYTDKGVYGQRDFLTHAKRESEHFPPTDPTEGHSVEMLAEYLSRSVRVYFDTFADLPDELVIFKLFVYTPDPAKKSAFEAYATGQGAVTVTSSYPNNVEVSDARGHKGAGLIAVANHYGIDIAHTVAMGDNYNDTGMLQTAGLAIAMGNAEDPIKQMAHVVTLSNDEDGVAHAINTYVLA